VSPTIRQLAELVHGQVLGDGGLPIQAARPLDDAGPGDITFVEAGKPVQALHHCRASAAVVPPSVSANGLTVIQVADPLMAFVAIVRHLQGRPETTGPRGLDPRASVHPSVQFGPDPGLDPFAVVGEGTVVGARCRIHSGAVVGRFCRLGDDVVLYPNVVLYDGTVLGDRVIIHANAVLGADGFGYRQHNGGHVKVPQLGHVEIGDDVEIGACTTIDRGTFRATTVGAGTKIDNLVQIGHNSRIGRHNLFAGQVGIAGSSTTGDYVVAGGQVGIADHVHIGDHVMIGGQSGVCKDIPADQRVFGAPAISEARQFRVLKILEKLPDMYRDLRRVKEHLGLAED
jgi:UDP-3-O-[3-hydroxymyristoyl] glucosamine N-acyltransferase